MSWALLVVRDCVRVLFAVEGTWPGQRIVAWYHLTDRRSEYRLLVRKPVTSAYSGAWKARVDCLYYDDSKPRREDSTVQHLRGQLMSRLT